MAARTAARQEYARDRLRPMLSSNAAATMHVTSELPPNEMNGSGTPVTGHDDVTTPMLIEALARRSSDAQPTASSEPKRSGARERDAHGAVGEHDEEREHDDRPEQAQLLADDREDEVGVLFGQIEELLPREPESEPERSRRCPSA